MIKFRLLTTYFILAIYASRATAEIKCPDMPISLTQIGNDVKSDISASIGSLGKIKAGELAIKTELIAKNIFEKHPNVDKLLTLQTMSSTYCSMLNTVTISDLEKIRRWEAFQAKVLNFDSASRQRPKITRNHSTDNKNNQHEKIEKLISEFYSMGVDLNATLRCDDTEGLTKYNIANAKYSEVYTLADIYGLKEKYRYFFFKNGQSVYSACKG